MQWIFNWFHMLSRCSVSKLTKPWTFLLQIWQKRYLIVKYHDHYQKKILVNHSCGTSQRVSVYFREFTHVSCVLLKHSQGVPPSDAGSVHSTAKNKAAKMRKMTLYTESEITRKSLPINWFLLVASDEMLVASLSLTNVWRESSKRKGHMI